MAYSDMEFGYANTNSITFTNEHSSAPTSIICTIVSTGSNSTVYSIVASGATQTGFNVRRTWRTGSDGGAATEYYYWIAIWR